MRGREGRRACEDTCAQEQLVGAPRIQRAEQIGNGEQRKPQREPVRARDDAEFVGEGVGRREEDDGKRRQRARHLHGPQHLLRAIEEHRVSHGIPERERDLSREEDAEELEQEVERHRRPFHVRHAKEVPERDLAGEDEGVRLVAPRLVVAQRIDERQ